MKKKISKCLFRIITLYLAIPAIIALILYFFLPIILNYPPESINNQFQLDFDGITYTQQYIVLIALIVMCSLVILFIRSFKMYKCFEKLTKTDTQLSKQETLSILVKMRTYCYNTPYLLYFLEILLPLIFLPITFIIIDAYTLTIINICLMYISCFTLASVISFVFSKNEFGYILNLLHAMHPNLMDDIELEYSQKKRPKIKSLFVKLLLQFSPLVLLTLILTSLVGYVQTAKKSGEIYYSSYLTLVSDSFSETFDSLQSVKNKLEDVTLLDESHKYFIIDSSGNYMVSDNSELRPFFIKYTLEKSESQNGYTHDYFCLDTEGIALKCILANGDFCYAGIKYDTSQPTFLRFIVICDIVLYNIIFLILLYVSYSLSKEIKTVSSKLTKIASSNKNTINLNNNLVITSEDELADLSIAFNLTQSFTKGNINQLQSNQTMLMEKERLASLGQLIGGIAHNLKTPIMSISGAAEGLNDLVKEYDISIDTPEVTKEDHHEIAKDMKSWIEKIRTHTEYMSDVITAVKGQAVNLSKEAEISFTVGELLKRVNILMKHELKNAIVYLNISMKADENTLIHGDVNSLVQVINNMVSNSIQAYNGKPDQNIDLTVEANESSLLISVKDYGSGIPKKVKDKLFKEMITTKGKNGTGLGLYMSYSTIKAHFNGNITIDSEEGKGTTFTIILPL